MALLGLAGCSPSPPPKGSTQTPQSEGASLDVRWSDTHHRYTTRQLLAHPGLVKVTVKQDAAYPNPGFTYQAIPLIRLFEGAPVEADASLAYQCKDGFASNLPAPLALNRNPDASRAYLAIESPEDPWPALQGKSTTAGPFYLIWEDPERSGVGREQWPFQLTQLSLQPSLAKLYPDLLPPKSDARAQRGYEAFVKNCFPCHTLNHQGASHFGPDLNLPMNPTRYFARDVLKKFIRDPRSVRSWPGMQMVAFGPEVLPDGQLEDLIHYLEQMARR